MAGGGRRRNPDSGHQQAADGARVPPHDHNAEEAILGAALGSSKALEVLALKLRPEDFYRPAHGHIAAALIEAFENGSDADPVTIHAALQARGLADQVDGLPGLLDLHGRTPSYSNAATYAEIVHDRATLRRLIGRASDIAELGFTMPGDVHQAVETAQQLLADVAANNGQRSYSTLKIADVASIVAGDLQPVNADFLTRTDGLSLFYAGKIHWLQAEPSAGKTFLALLASSEVLAMGGSVLYLDYEDSDRGIIGRLLGLGVEAEAAVERFAYVQPESGFGLAEKTELGARLDQLNPDLIVIDGVAEALVRDGFSEDRNTEVIQWIENVPRWLARTGAAVVLLDHLKKPQPGETGQRYARGAGAKLGALDGAAYELRVQVPFSRHRAGKVAVVVAKDRPGGVGAIRETVAVAHIEPSAAGAVVKIRLEPPPVEGGDAAPWRPTHVMEQLSRELEKAESPMAAAAVKRLVHGQRKVTEEALARLQQEGYVFEIRTGGTPLLRSVKPFRADDDPGPQEPPPDGDRDFSDESLFADNPGTPPDELAARRADRDQEEDHE